MKAVIVIAQASVNSFATWAQIPQVRGLDRVTHTEDNGPRRSSECFRSSTFRRTPDPCSTRIGRYRHRAYTKTCQGATSVALMRRRSLTEFFMSYPASPQGYRFIAHLPAGAETGQPDRRTLLF